MKLTKDWGEREVQDNQNCVLVRLSVYFVGHLFV